MTLFSRLRIGTRCSPLSLAQTHLFTERLCALGIASSIISVTTRGDKIKDQPLYKFGGKGLFSKEIHDLLIDGTIDCGFHSLKDLETSFPKNINLGCIFGDLKYRYDILIVRNKTYCCIQDLPPRFRLGTCSPRRTHAALYLNPSIEIVPMRGNVETRLLKLAQGQADGIILASSGLQRLNLLDMLLSGYPLSSGLLYGFPLKEKEMPTAMGQGFLAANYRTDRDDVGWLLKKCEDPKIAFIACAERSFLHVFSGNCRTAAGVVSEITETQVEGLAETDEKHPSSLLLKMTAYYFPTKKACIKVTKEGNDPFLLGSSLAESIRSIPFDSDAK